MAYYAYVTDKGIKKSINQDALMIKEATTSVGKIYLLVVCDGMGGLSYGEVASKMVVEAFDKWFCSRMGYVLAKENIKDVIKNEWIKLINDISIEINGFGQAKNASLGTTCTACIMLDSGEYIYAHVGDTRLYKITSDTISQLTTDQTVIAKEIADGKITEEEAKVDSRRNMLLQAIGASEVLDIEMDSGKVMSNEVYLICCDGFRHKISNLEFLERLSPRNNRDKNDLETNLSYLLEENKKRRETDNITAVAIRF